MPWGTWVAQWLKLPTSAQVIISQLVSSSPASSSGACFRFYVSISLSALPRSRCLSLSLSKKINIRKKKEKCLNHAFEQNGVLLMCMLVYLTYIYEWEVSSTRRQYKGKLVSICTLRLFCMEIQEWLSACISDDSSKPLKWSVPLI